MLYVWLALLGLVIGAIGTLIGAGGGFLLMPILVLKYPDESPETLASISLAVVMFNAMSGSYGYARQKLIDYRAGFAFLAAGVPGAVIGAFATGYFARKAFDITLGVALILIATWIFIAGKRIKGDPHAPPSNLSAAHRRPQLIKGAVIAFVVGFVSSLLGIGGGIIHVPAMVYLLQFPVHVATATSHFVLAGTALSGTLVHVFQGTFGHGYKRTAALAIGVVIGAQIGAKLARKAAPTWIMRGLAVALAIVGARVVWGALHKP